MAEASIASGALLLASMTEWNWVAIVAIVSTVIGGLALVATVISLAEKINVDAEEDLEPAEMPAPPEEVRVLAAAGLSVVKTGFHRTSSLLHSHVWVLMSADGAITAGVLSTKIGSTATIVSRRTDGIWITTKMAVGMPSPRPSRVLIDTLCGGASTAEPTLALHRLRLAEQNMELDQFDAGDAWRVLGEAERALHEDRIDAGLCRWVEPSRTMVRLTLKGAFFSFFKLRGIPQEAVGHYLRGPGVKARAAKLPPLQGGGASRIR